MAGYGDPKAVPISPHLALLKADSHPGPRAEPGRTELSPTGHTTGPGTWNRTSTISLTPAVLLARLERGGPSSAGLELAGSWLQSRGPGRPPTRATPSSGKCPSLPRPLVSPLDRASIITHLTATETGSSETLSNLPKDTLQGSEGHSSE